MQKKILLLLAVLTSFYYTDAQQLSFGRTYSTSGPTNLGRDIIELSNGDLLIAGVRSVPMSGGQYVANVILLKLKPNGDTIWVKEIGTITERELGYALTQLPNNNIIITGSINIPPNGLSNAIVICTDNNGNLLWQKEYGGGQSDYATDVIFDGQNIVVCGITESFGAGNSDAWLLKLNTLGDTLWTKTYGGVNIDDAWKVVYVNNAYYFTGGTYSYANGSFDDAWIVKTDTSGNEIWKKSYGVANKVDWAWSIIPAYNNNVIDGFVFCGVKDTEESAPGNSRGSLHFVKVDTNGNVIWDKSIANSGSTNWRMEGFDIAQLADDGFVICGYKLEPTVQSQQLYIVRTDASGAVVWDTAYGTSDSNYYAYALTATNDGGWVVAGSVFDMSQPYRYIYIARFSNEPNNIAMLNDDVPLVSIYPNPVEKELNILTSEDNYIENIKIYNVGGKLIMERAYDMEKSVSINIINTGYYIIEIETSEGIVRRKVVKN